MKTYCYYYLTTSIKTEYLYYSAVFRYYIRRFCKNYLFHEKVRHLNHSYRINKEFYYFGKCKILIYDQRGKLVLHTPFLFSNRPIAAWVAEALIFKRWFGDKQNLIDYLPFIQPQASLIPGDTEDVITLSGVFTDDEIEKKTCWKLGSVCEEKRTYFRCVSLSNFDMEPKEFLSYLQSLALESRRSLYL